MQTAAVPCAHGARAQALDLGRRLAALEAGEVDQRHGARRRVPAATGAGARASISARRSGEDTGDLRQGGLEQVADAVGRGAPTGSSVSAWVSGSAGQAGGEVGHDRDRRHLEPGVPRADRLGHGRHADQIGAQRAVGADLGRRLEGGPEHGEVDAAAERDAARAAAAAIAARKRAARRPRSGRRSAGRSARRWPRPAGWCPAG